MTVAAPAPPANPARPPKNRNVSAEHRIAFVHNPKAAGSSFRNWIGLTGPTDHRFPTFSITRNVWESYRTVLFVRHPVSRLISSYFYHCGENYSGAYKKKYPDINEWDLSKYFDIFSSKEINAIAPQYLYSIHLNSFKIVDYIFRIELINENKLRDIFKVDAKFPVINQSKVKEKIDIEGSLWKRVRDYYERDFLIFGFDEDPRSVKTN